MKPVLYCFPARLDALPDLLAHLQTAASGLDMGSLLRAETALEELFVNSVHYGYQLWPDDGEPPSVWLGVSIAGDSVHLSYQDLGVAFDPFSGLEQVTSSLDAPLEDRHIGGLGRLLVQRLADHSGYHREDGRNCIELRFDPRVR